MNINNEIYLGVGVGVQTTQYQTNILNSLLKVVQNFKTITGYERRITQDEMMKLYADRNAVQRHVC